MVAPMFFGHAELSKLIETAEFERAWQNDSNRNPNVTAAIAFAGQGVTITIDFLLSSLEDLTISMQHSVPPFAGSTNIALQYTMVIAEGERCVSRW
jgi:hypothetical protein